MKTFRSYLPESFLAELAVPPTDAASPISGDEASEKPNPNMTEDGNRELSMGDPVKIKGRVEHSGESGKIVDFDSNKSFVVVKLRHGNCSFHSSDVEYDDYADVEGEESNDNELNNLRRLSGY